MSDMESQNKTTAAINELDKKISYLVLRAHLYSGYEVGVRQMPPNLKVLDIEGLDNKTKDKLMADLEYLVPKYLHENPKLQIRFEKSPDDFSKLYLYDKPLDYESCLSMSIIDMWSRYQSWCLIAEKWPSVQFIYIINGFFWSVNLYSKVFCHKILRPEALFPLDMIGHHWECFYRFVNLECRTPDGYVESKSFFFNWLKFVYDC